MIPRKIQNNLINHLEKKEILLLIGARQVGKTTILKYLKKYLEKNGAEVYFFTLEDVLLLEKLNSHPEKIFEYVPKKDEKIYLILDEIQYLKNPSNFLKYIYDLFNEKIKLIISDSSAFYIDQKFKDSLAGRKRIFEIHPFCFSEFLIAKGEENLSKKIMKNNFFKTNEKIDLLVPEKNSLKSYMSEYLQYGGYPGAVIETDLDEKKYILKELFQSFLKKDILEEKIKSEEKFYILLKILAEQSGQLVNNKELSNAIGVSSDTIEKFIYILEKSFILKRVRPFFSNIRKELTRMPKLYFLDMGYRNAVLNIFQGLDSRTDKGAILENSFFIEVVKQNVDKINFWRTQNKAEIDFVINEKMAFEIKFNSSSFNKNKYKTFIENYPGIELRPVCFSDDRELDLMDFVT